MAKPWLKHNHAKFISNVLEVWKPVQFHYGRCSVITPPYSVLKIKRAAEFNIDCSIVAAAREVSK